MGEYLMQKNNTFELKIAYYRKLKGITQSELADMVGVSCQAVSKWERQISYPDITVLPALAQILGVTIDELFETNAKKDVVYNLVENVPWNDDGKIRIAVYSGRKLVDQVEHICSGENKLINFRFYGDQYNVNGVCKVNCIKSGKK